MAGKLQALLTRQTRFRGAVAVLCVLSVCVLAFAGYINCCYTVPSVTPIPDQPVTAGVSVMEATNQGPTSDRVRVTAVWTKSGTSNNIIIAAGDAEKKLTNVSDSASIPGLENGDKLKITGEIDTRQDLIRTHTVGQD